MKNNTLIILLLVLFLMINLNLLGQSFSFTKINVEEMIAEEEQKNSEQTKIIDEFGILVNPHFDINTTTPSKVYIYRQFDDDFDPQLHIWYHFDSVNNQLIGKRYYWGLYNPSFNPRIENNRQKKLSRKEKEYLNKYNSLQEEIKSIYGDPIKINTIADNKNRLIEEMFWETDEIIIDLTISFCRKVPQKKKTYFYGDMKIEVMITAKKSNQ